jgi:transitional endoplasmic reticulum ATPase
MDRLLSLLLCELDGARQHGSDGSPPLVLLGATREHSLLDPAILRPGRLDVHLYVGLPDAVQRRALLQHQLLASTPVAWAEAAEHEAAEHEAAEQAAATDAAGAGDVSLEWLVALTEGYSLAQLSALCRKAAMAALRESLDAPRVQMAHFEGALLS